MLMVTTEAAKELKLESKAEGCLNYLFEDEDEYEKVLKEVEKMLPVIRAEREKVRSTCWPRVAGSGRLRNGEGEGPLPG